MTERNEYMLPQVNGSTRIDVGQFIWPQNKVTFYGDPAYTAVLQARLEKVLGNCIWERIEIEEKDNANLSILMIPDQREKAPGSYIVEITSKKAAVEASDGEGIANGLTTLYWILREGQGKCACQRIVDEPRFAFRSFMMDVSRHFFDSETVKEMIEQCSLRKLNRMHWHLSDDQGWRIECKRFPELNKVSSWRKEIDGSIYGGYYTKDEIQDIISYAKVRGVEIIPEIDMPGHVSAILSAFPSLSCIKEQVDVKNMGGIYEKILCAGSSETLDFVYAILDEVAELFPFPLFHIGGDEAPKSEWIKCPVCQAKIRDEKLENEEALQAWFTDKIISYLQEKGKRCICWNESLKSKCLSPQAVIQYWDEEGEETGYCKELTEGSRKCIYSYTSGFYLDYSPALLPLRRVFYNADHFSLRDGTKICNKNLLGMEALLWSEQINDGKTLQRMAFPRIFAVAEKAWCETTSYQEFLKICQEQLRWMKADGIAHFTIEEADPDKAAQKRSVLAEWSPKIKTARLMGMEQYAPIICGLVRKKLSDTMEYEEVDEILSELMVLSGQNTF
jgi:hexosaminidase